MALLMIKLVGATALLSRPRLTQIAASNLIWQEGSKSNMSNKLLLLKKRLGVGA
jgi:hypothetical protein